MPDNQLRSSAAAYAKWITALMDYIESGGKSGLELELDPDRCEIGQWLNDRRPALSHLHEYARFDEAHRKLHDHAKAVVGLVQAGDKSSAYAAMKPGGEFSSISRRLIMDLDDLLARAESGH